jgi:hypothetical protein
VHETFADAQQCFACTDYFSDALAINIDDVPLVGDEKDILAVRATKLGTAVEARAAFLNQVLDAILRFLDERASTRPGDDGTATCQNILATMEPTREYFNCMNKYVLAKFDCKPNGGAKLECSQVLPIVDLVMKKAVVCGRDCGDVKLYPRADEQAVCRQTSVCKTVAELENNIRRYADEVRQAVSNCQQSLVRGGGGDTDCALTYAKALLTKKKARAAIELSDAEKARGVQLGSGYGQNDVIFDMNTLVIANGTAKFT